MLGLGIECEITKNSALKRTIQNLPDTLQKIETGKTSFDANSELTNSNAKHNNYPIDFIATRRNCGAVAEQNVSS